jgi:hypothetical protein
VQSVVLVELHCWQLPAWAPLLMHTGLEGEVQPPPGPSPLQGAQTLLTHFGVAPEQFASVSHVTHWPVAVSHAGEAPPHWLKFVPEHWPQAPLDWQAGEVPPQLESLLQPVHASLVVSQTGLVPVHCVELLPEHCWQLPAFAPVLMHAGFAPLSHPPLGPSPLQGTHVFVAASHFGAVAVVQSESSRQPTHTPELVLHTGVVPVQRPVFPGEHCPQAPLS